MVIDSRKMAKKIADEALDNFLYDGKTIRELMQMIGSGDYIPRQNIEAAIAEIEEAKFKGFTDDNCKNHMPDHHSYFNAALVYAVKTINKHTKI